MAAFSPDLDSTAGEGQQARQELRNALRELGLQPSEDASGAVYADFTTGSYEPMSFRFWTPDDRGLIAAEGEVLTLDGPASDQLPVALNYLNVALDNCRFYLSGEVVCVRADLLPNLSSKVWFHPKELRHVLTDLCTQRAKFKDPLERIQSGRPWTAVKDAIRAFR